MRGLYLCLVSAILGGRRSRLERTWLGIRRSGLSEPYRAMASWYGIRGNGWSVSMVWPASFTIRGYSSRARRMCLSSSLSPSLLVGTSCPPISVTRQEVLMRSRRCQTRRSTRFMTSSPFANDISKSNCVLVSTSKPGKSKCWYRTYLCKLGLSVSTQVFVPEASRELEVVANAGGHEDLLVLLRALRQGVRISRPSCWYQKLPRALRRGLEEDRGLDVEKACPPEVVLCFHGQAVSEREPILKSLVEPQLQVSGLWWEQSAVGDDDVFWEGVEEMGGVESEPVIVVLWWEGRAIETVRDAIQGVYCAREGDRAPRGDGLEGLVELVRWRAGFFPR